uniref:Uncharacterized protein n=1 Tax=Chromera velia CCMP2878 TaxID=1169474 RepID=A0A0G4HQ53_9ALVE|eukprot:Cvel_7878.t1-p1 / transcript=Cvel_7878.t1 / gene=Cvel_7878 / organism=Chromera_velia_CCMP2878 / gene_product=hypothetical protein / transcript_product=hypothetical protein / location=Cvel_scaffold422:59935-63344(-) / protein_length=736 / sequence_SO=supercontig / SO=protein_coding / is_pseudo=false
MLGLSIVDGHSGRFFPGHSEGNSTAPEARLESSAQRSVGTNFGPLPCASTAPTSASIPTGALLVGAVSVSEPDAARTKKFQTKATVQLCNAAKSAPPQMSAVFPLWGDGQRGCSESTAVSQPRGVGLMDVDGGGRGEKKDLQMEEEADSMSDSSGEFLQFLRDPYDEEEQERIQIHGQGRPGAFEGCGCDASQQSLGTPTSSHGTVSSGLSAFGEALSGAAGGRVDRVPSGAEGKAGLAKRRREDEHASRCGDDGSMQTAADHSIDGSAAAAAVVHRKPGGTVAMNFASSSPKGMPDTGGDFGRSGGLDGFLSSAENFFQTSSTSVGTERDESGSVGIFGGDRQRKGERGMEERCETEEMKAALGYPQRYINPKILEELTYLMGHIDLFTTDVVGLFQWASGHVMSWAHHFPNRHILRVCHSALFSSLTGDRWKLKSLAATCSLFQNKLITPVERDRLILNLLERAVGSPHTHTHRQRQTQQAALDGDSSACSVVPGAGEGMDVRGGPLKRTRMGEGGQGDEEKEKGKEQGDVGSSEGIGLRQSIDGQIHTGLSGLPYSGRSGHADREEWGEKPNEDQAADLRGESSDQLERIFLHAAAKGAPLHAEPLDDDAGECPSPIPPSPADDDLSPPSHSSLRGPSGRALSLMGRSAGSGGVGLQGRAALKTMLSEKCRQNPKCRDRVLRINQIKYATLPQLIQMAMICGLEAEVRALQRQHASRTTRRPPPPQYHRNRIE